MKAKMETMEACESVRDCSEIDALIEKMTKKILDDIEESECWIAEDVNALAGLIEARAKL